MTTTSGRTFGLLTFVFMSLVAVTPALATGPEDFQARTAPLLAALEVQAGPVLVSR